MEPILKDVFSQHSAEFDALSTSEKLTVMRRLDRMPTIDINRERLSDSDKAEDFYNRKLREKLEATHLNNYVAIHPDSEDYAIDRRVGRALRTLRQRCPVGAIIVRSIGITDEGLLMRIRGKMPMMRIK